MARNTYTQWVKSYVTHRRIRKSPRRTPRLSQLESLETRITPAINAFFAGGQLTILGDAADNTIVVSRDDAGAIKINDGAVAIRGGTPTVANTARLQIFGLGGNDRLSLDELNGALPAANLFGGAGNDILTGGSGADLLFGQAGNDSLAGREGGDHLFGGAGNDILAGGAGNDLVFGELGNDTLLWIAGDERDLLDGGAGVDSAIVNGSNSADSLALVAAGAQIRIDSLEETLLEVAAENLRVNGNNGDDVISGSLGLASLTRLTLDGGAGNDELTGSDGEDLLIGGDGNDRVSGGRGNDVIQLGAGDDVFRWDVGDASDQVEGSAGSDALIFNGFVTSEIFEFSASGNRLRLTRNLGNIVMDVDEVERVDLNASNGADTVIINDLTNTDVTMLNVNLEAAAGGAGDGLADVVIINGNAGDDSIQIASFDNARRVAIATTFFPFINIIGAEVANDRLVVNTLDGDDIVDAGSLAASAIRLTLDGGAGDDVLVAGGGDDILLGGEGDDQLFGGPGVDILEGGPGDNVIDQG